jgi:protease II
VEWRDPYAWLRDDRRQRPEVLAHLRAENAYTEAMTRHTAKLQERSERYEALRDEAFRYAFALDVIGTGEDHTAAEHR